ncbi:Uncharacterised protein [Vibrio cholerae]|nr:Uncharacterised protein [Vibrio cholerae]
MTHHRDFFAFVCACKAKHTTYIAHLLDVFQEGFCNVFRT